MRLKALRDGQQLIEYLTMLSGKEDLTREQLRGAVEAMVNVEIGTRGGSGVDDADSQQAVALAAGSIQALRRALADRLAGR